MIVDTSALAAILLSEVDAAEIGEKLAQSLGNLSISAAILVQLGLLADNPAKFCNHDDVDALIAGLRIEIIPVTAEDARLARAAHTRFGRWSGGKARLNFGDCFSYALSERTGRALLYKGNDFGRTDVRKAL
jgi:ribonuclease VapC